MTHCSHEMTVTSLSEINHALRRQVVDLLLSIAVMKENAAIQSATKRSKNEAKQERRSSGSDGRRV